MIVQETAQVRGATCVTFLLKLPGTETVRVGHVELLVSLSTRSFIRRRLKCMEKLLLMTMRFGQSIYIQRSMKYC